MYFMIRLSARLACLLTVLILFNMNVNAQQNTSAWTARKSAAWFREGEWNKGIKAHPHPSIDKLEFARQYHADKQLWTEVLAFLNRKDLNALAPGKYLIAGDSAYAMISEFTAKKPEETQYESHRKYIDVQYVIRGKERIGVAPLASAKVTEPYDASKDIAHYRANGKFYLATPAQFFIFFPGDAHRPDLEAGHPAEQVKKLVIKVMVMQTGYSSSTAAQ